tara:strand:+ start:172 stop:558 length:387 start_codon:yes stop_codon:yes gene_type:complete
MQNKQVDKITKPIAKSSRTPESTPESPTDNLINNNAVGFNMGKEFKRTQRKEDIEVTTPKNIYSTWQEYLLDGRSVVDCYMPDGNVLHWRQACPQDAEYFKPTSFTEEEMEARFQKYLNHAKTNGGKW